VRPSALLLAEKPEELDDAAAESVGASSIRGEFIDA
jgi:hypothetical protein